MKKLFTLLAATVAVALCLVSCKKDNAGSKYGTANIGGVSWNSVELTYISTQIMEDYWIFRLVLDADTKRVNMGHIYYDLAIDELRVGAWGDAYGQEDYIAELVSGKKEIKKVDDSHFSINIDGTDEVGNKLVVKGTATLTDVMH